jgi:ribosomal-protein-serine acetyltransferase
MFVISVCKEIELRESDPVHAPELFDLIETNREHLRRWLPWLDQTTRLQHVQQFLRESRRKAMNGNGQTFLVINSGRIVGVLGEHNIDRVDRKTELGYWLDQGHEGRGIMTQAVERLLGHIFDDLDLNRVVLSCAVGNVKSRAIPERLGFVHEGVLRQAQWLYTHYIDLAVYGLLREEWLKRRRRHI